MEENNNINENARSVYDLWLHNIFEQLDALKQSIFLAREGFSSMQELISTPEIGLYLVRERNIKYALILFESLLNDLQTQVDKNFFECQMNVLLRIKKDLYTNIDNFFNLQGSKNNRTYYPTRLYYVVCDVLEKERAKLIKEISSLLYAQSKQVKNKPI